ncbi:hypothetical protein KM043_000142, partial [Ampulex compressa]
SLQEGEGLQKRADGLQDSNPRLGSPRAKKSAWQLGQAPFSSESPLLETKYAISNRGEAARAPKLRSTLPSLHIVFFYEQEGRIYRPLEQNSRSAEDYSRADCSALCCTELRCARVMERFRRSGLGGSWRAYGTKEKGLSGKTERQESGNAVFGGQREREEGENEWKWGLEECWDAFERLCGIICPSLNRPIEGVGKKKLLGRAVKGLVDY